MYRYLYNLVKTKIPKISSTEMTALRSGNTSLDRYILQGKFVYPETKPFKKKIQDEKINNLIHQSLLPFRPFPNPVAQLFSIVSIDLDM